ncbi:NAD(P)-dependent oxidoreductase [Bradyrhizobium sp. 1(2017)]|uniref:NAD(P)-dependent oxidoreductase n=1 Tax=Bradyrhizobium sp. 1(2017) TaxID=1404888 RepID=UPI001FEF9572|nr:NAD(P)H-binding protein [Bradyrhizobium sp. 1(2017)]
MNDLTNDGVKTVRSKVLVLGATGATGRLIASQALERGHQVSALVRSPEKASKLNGARLVVGDVRDEKALREALKGQDAVVSALGTPASPLPRGDAALNRDARARQRAEHVSRLVCITGIGAGDSAGHGGFLFDKVIFPFLLKNVYADKNRQEAAIRNSGLDWILVHPSVLATSPAAARSAL